MEYGIIVTNKFHFLSDDETADPSEILGKASQIKKLKGTSISKVPQNAALAAQQLPKPEKPEKQQPEIANKENAARRGNRGNSNRTEGDRRPPRPEGERRPRPEGEHRPRPEGERRPRPDGERRDDKRRDENQGADGERRFDNNRRFDGERRGGRGRGNFNRPEGERRPPRPDGERPQRPEGERRPPRHEGERRPRPEGEVAPIEGEERHDADRRPSGRGRGGNFGARRGGANRGDRMDRTGVRSVDKKEGSGRGNWGTQQDELKGETEPVVEATEGEKPAEEENADKNDSGVEVEKEEEKPVGMTLSEWKEKNKPIETESFNVRKPEDVKKLNLAPLKRTEDNDKDKEEFVVLRRDPREKHIDISVNFAAVDRGEARGERRGRGEGRGRGERRGDGDRRGDFRGRGARTEYGQRDNRTRGNNSNFNLVNDQFPALGAH